MSRILASTAQCSVSAVWRRASPTAATYAATQSVLARTWSTQVSSTRPRRSASATFSAIELRPSENVEWTCMS